MTYCEDLEMLSIGLANGAISNLSMDIESRFCFDQDDMKLSDSSLKDQVKMNIKD